MNPHIQEHLSEIAAICRRWRVRRLELFGSAARADFVADRSDIDLLVEFESIAPQEYADAFFGLEADLQRVFGAPVDLIEVIALRNPYLRRSIEEDKVPLYETA